MYPSSRCTQLLREPFAQQRDELPYVSPNYDAYLFEVETSSGIKMLHEIEPRRVG